MKCTKYNIWIYSRRIKSTSTCTGQLTISSVCKTSEKTMCDPQEKLFYNITIYKKGKGLLIEGNFNSGISYLSNI